MKAFGGSALLIDRDDINTDEIIPAKYLTEISKNALKPHLLEDLLIDGKPLEGRLEALSQAQVIISRSNFGCGSSREHAVWAFEVNDINVIIATSYARIFRQNMFNCGILPIELDSQAIDEVFILPRPLSVSVNLTERLVTVRPQSEAQQERSYPFRLNEFELNLVEAGGWLAFAENRY